MIKGDAELTRALELIKQRNYPAARDILLRIDHPLAEQWLQKIMMQGTMERTKIDGLSVESPIGSGLDDEPLISTLEARQLGMWSIIASVIGFSLAIMIGATGGVFLYFLRTEFDYQLIIFPAMLILFSSFVFRVIVSSLRIKSRHVLVFLVMMLGLMTYGTYWYWQYADFLSFTNSEPTILFNVPGESTRADDILQEATGYTGLQGFVLFSADFGQEISRGQVIEVFDDFRPRLEGDGALAYWGFELLLMLLIPLLFAGGSKKREFVLS